MDFVIPITDPARLAAITAAREARNESLPIEMAMVDVPNPLYNKATNPNVPATIKKEMPTGRKVGQIDTDADYMTWTVMMATDSWVRQHDTGIPEPVTIPGQS